MRKVLAITGTRADYGLMRPVFEAIAACRTLELELVVTGMHLLPEFSASLSEVEKDSYCPLHRVNMALGEDSGMAMARSLGQALLGIAPLIETVRPDIVLLQGDRGEMLAGAIAAAHMNIPAVHMSGGDFSGTIDDSIRNAISKFSHIHLTTCPSSTDRLMAMGESRSRIVEVGEPGLDVIRTMTFIPPVELAADLGIDVSKPLVLAAQHPVTTEAGQAAHQIAETLEALASLGMQVVFTYPNSDAGGRDMVRVLESYRDRDSMRIIPHLGSNRFLSLMKIAAVLVGNSSSGILEAASFKLPVVNIGTRQHGRLRACNVVDAGYDRTEIAQAVTFVLTDAGFRERLAGCCNPYGDGTAASRTVDVLRRIVLKPALLSKWMDNGTAFLERD
jgi:UDP-N-acetylglucosamine 2-epimerase (non-hydrolysing)/GDP/UDP-N,N'-diacetylbacillosamine 2-epimerase (hydrolysing)